jgi:hypothetical protein
MESYVDPAVNEKLFVVQVLPLPEKSLPKVAVLVMFENGK